jgi:hypothetical protein
MNTYKTTTPNGRTISQNSKRVYTHAVACKTDERDWYVSGFCGSLELATKAANAQHNYLIRNTATNIQVEILEVVGA